jgi:hypothetical protein
MKTKKCLTGNKQVAKIQHPATQNGVGFTDNPHLKVIAETVSQNTVPAEETVTYQCLDSTKGVRNE